MIMKCLLLASVIVTVIATENNPGNKLCEPRSKFYVECNQCRCANDGSGAVCSRMYCPPGKYNKDGAQIGPPGDDLYIVDEPPQRCEPDHIYKLDCNRCVCSLYRELSCTNITCVHPPEKRSVRIDYPELPDSNCEFGKTYRKGCNTCFCGKMGITTCTLMNCNADIVYYNKNRRDVENWGPRYQQGDECEPRKTFFSECNECRCGNNGRSAVCTLKMCPPRQE